MLQSECDETRRPGGPGGEFIFVLLPGPFFLESLMGFGKKSDVEITRPLKHRPGVLLIKQNGSQKVLGDGDPYTYQEYIELRGGYVESTTPRLQFTDSEQAEIDAAEDCLTRVSALVDTLHDDGRRLYEKLRAALNEEQQEVAAAQLQELRGRIEHNNKLESHALLKRNAIRQRITVAARERQFPIE